MSFQPSAISSQLVVALLFAAPAALAASTEEEAGDVSEVDKDASGPLKERIPPVTGHLFLHKKRFELSPGITFSLKDAFFSKYVLGLDAAFHINENIGIDARFGYSIPTVSGAAQICIPPGATQLGKPGCSAPSMQAISGIAPGEINMVGSVNVEWAPLYGKIALASEYFSHFDLHAVAGPAFVQYTGPGPGSNAFGPVPASMFTVGGNIGIGMRFFINKWMAVRTELSDLIYSETVVLPAQGSSLRNQLMFDLGFSMFFPQGFQEG